MSRADIGRNIEQNGQTQREIFVNSKNRRIVLM